MLARNPSAGDFRDVRVLISCTAPLDQRLCVTAEAAFGRPVLQSFGTTETLIVSVESPGRDAATAFSSGQIVGGARAVSLDRDGGSDGVLRIHNGAVTPGYATCAGGRVEMSLPGGGIPGQLFVSGDLARLTAAGNLEIVGRTTNVINVGGVKISVEQMEEVLRSDPSVIDAAVAALAGADGDEKPMAFVSARGPVDKQRLIDACVQRLGSKARLADIRVVPAIPLTANGKIDRVALTKKLAP
jgi:acyl-coenzyme A synthetase/AMP-(fatty) acid ligase